MFAAPQGPGSGDVGILSQLKMKFKIIFGTASLIQGRDAQLS